MRAGGKFAKTPPGRIKPGAGGHHMSSWSRTCDFTGSDVRGRVKLGVPLCNGLVTTRPLQTRSSIDVGLPLSLPHKFVANLFHHRGTKALFSRLLVTSCLRGSSENVNRWQICKVLSDNVSSHARVRGGCPVGDDPAI